MQLKRSDLDRIFSQALDEYPSECCGILTVGPRGGVSQVHPCENIQDNLHRQDPDRYSRDSRTAYYIDPEELYKFGSSAEKAGGKISGFFHSHIDCDAYFSDEDKERAMIWDEPAYPDAIYLVVSVCNKNVKGYKCFGWDGSLGHFTEADLKIVE